MPNPPATTRQDATMMHHGSRQNSRTARSGSASSVQHKVMMAQAVPGRHPQADHDEVRMMESMPNSASFAESDAGGGGGGALPPGGRGRFDRSNSRTIGQDMLQGKHTNFLFYSQPLARATRAWVHHSQGVCSEFPPSQTLVLSHSLCCSSDPPPLCF
jgi:hypothetical protein